MGFGFEIETAIVAVAGDGAAIQGCGSEQTANIVAVVGPFAGGIDYRREKFVIRVAEGLILMNCVMALFVGDSDIAVLVVVKDRGIVLMDNRERSAEGVEDGLIADA